MFLWILADLSTASLLDYGDGEDSVDMDHANLLDVLVEDKVKFKSSYEVGDASMEIFMDKTNPWNKSIHPALPKIIQEKLLANRRYGKNETLLTAQAFQKNYKCLRKTEKIFERYFQFWKQKQTNLDHIFWSVLLQLSFFNISSWFCAVKDKYKSFNASKDHVNLLIKIECSYLILQNIFDAEIKLQRQNYGRKRE